MTEEIVRQAAAHVEMARELFELNFDYSEQSLTTIDEAISKFHPEGNILDTTIVTYGAYIGETLRRNLGGVWAETDDDTMLTDVGGTGPLAFRPEARKNLILVTDKNCDLPFYVENREAGQTGTEPPTPLTAPWQAVIANAAFVNLLVSGSGVVRNQYGDPAQSVSDANFLNYNPEATLSNLITAGFGGSLEAQTLAAGLVGRAFSIGSVNTTNFIANFFAAKVEEITSNPIPPPRLHIAALPNAVRLTWTTNSAGYLLQTNRSLTLTNGWGALPTNYGTIGTNYAVTNSISDALRFYRLRK